MKNILLIIGFLSFCLGNVAAGILPWYEENVEIEEEVISMDDDSIPAFTVEKRSGWHFGTYLGSGFVIGNMENSPFELLYGNSYSIDFGIKARYQFNPTYSWIFYLGWLHNRYKISDGTDNDFLGGRINLNNDNNYTVDNERFRTWGVSFNFGNRFNFDRKKKFKENGKYIEVSAYGSYNFSRKYLLTMHENNDIKINWRYQDPTLFNPFEAGVQVNFGFEYFSIWGRYRFTDCFNNDKIETKLPPFVAGIAISF